MSLKLIDSVRPAFRYHWNWGPAMPRYLAGTRVAVLHLDPTAIAERTAALAASIAGKNTMRTNGALELREMNSRFQRELSTMLATMLIEEGLKPFKYMHEMEPQLAVARDTVAFHHDMPMMGSVFGAWCLSGPERTFRMPMLDIEVPFVPGTVVIFDPAQPHGLVRPGQAEFIENQSDALEVVTFISFTGVKDSSLGTLVNAATYDSGQHGGIAHTAPQYEVCRRTGNVELRAPC